MRKTCGRSSTVEHDLAKVETRVQLPLPAPNKVYMKAKKCLTCSDTGYFTNPFDQTFKCDCKKKKRVRTKTISIDAAIKICDEEIKKVIDEHPDFGSPPFFRALGMAKIKERFLFLKIKK